MMREYEELIYLRTRVIELEREVETLRSGHAKSIDLMMRGEFMRERLMIKAICAGAFEVPNDRP